MKDEIPKVGDLIIYLHSPDVINYIIKIHLSKKQKRFSVEYLNDDFKTNHDSFGIVLFHKLILENEIKWIRRK